MTAQSFGQSSQTRPVVPAPSIAGDFVAAWQHTSTGVRNATYAINQNACKLSTRLALTLTLEAEQLKPSAAILGLT